MLAIDGFAYEQKIERRKKKKRAWKKVENDEGES